MRRSISSNGGLAPSGVQAGGSLRGIPSEWDQKGKYRKEFGSLRGLPSPDKKLSNLDEGEEVEHARPSVLPRNEFDHESENSWDTASLNVPQNVNSNSSPGTRSKKLNKDVQNIKVEGVNKSTESLTSVGKKKKAWWLFRRNKAEKDATPSGLDGDGAVTFNGALSEKASSNIDISSQPIPENSMKIEEESNRSQILLKGYSQRNIPGVSLSGRLSSTNPSVTSRASLGGSDILVSDKHNSPRHLNTFTDSSEKRDQLKDQSYEALLEKDLCQNNLKSLNDGEDHEEKHPTPSSVSIDISTRAYEDSLLSPDSRPIRPLCYSSPAVPVPDSSPTVRTRHTHVSSSQESYPHSLMDRPIITRMAKRRSSENSRNSSESETTPLKKSNIAYTLTFQDEPICVNLRTKNQPLTPESFPTERLSADQVMNFSSASPVYKKQTSLQNDRDMSSEIKASCKQGKSASGIPIKKTAPSDSHNSSLTDSSKDLNGHDDHPDNTEVTPYIGTETCTSKIEMKMETDVTVVHDIKTVSVGENKSNNEASNDDGSSLATVVDEDTKKQEDSSEIKPVSKLQRRNTFTLPNKKDVYSNESQTSENVETNEIENSETLPKKSPETLQLVLDETREKNVILSVCHSPVQDQDISGNSANGELLNDVINIDHY